MYRNGHTAAAETGKQGLTFLANFTPRATGISFYIPRLINGLPSMGSISHLCRTSLTTPPARQSAAAETSRNVCREWWWDLRRDKTGRWKFWHISQRPRPMPTSELCVTTLSIRFIKRDRPCRAWPLFDMPTLQATRARQFRYICQRLTYVSEWGGRRRRE